MLGARCTLCARRHCDRLDLHHGITLCASCGERSAARDYRRPVPGLPKMHRPSKSFLAAPAILAAAGLLFGLWPTQLDDALDSYAEHGARRRGLRPRAVAWAGSAAVAVDSRARRGHCRVLRPRPAASLQPVRRAAGQRRPDLRRRPARRGPAVGAADRGHPTRFDPRDAVGDPVDVGAGADRRAGHGRPRSAGLRVVGLAGAGGGRAHRVGGRARRDRSCATDWRPYCWSG